MSLKNKLHQIIFEADTPSGKSFDIALIIFVILSMIAVLLESVEAIRTQYFFELIAIEWFFTVVFTIEYLLRLSVVERPLRYAFSFFGLVDLFSIIPTYLSFFIPGAQSFLLIRGFRLLRIFRVLKLSRFTNASSFLSMAVRQSRHKITIFLGFVLTVVVIAGAFMYLIEGKENGFTSIPKAIYWAIVTMTTVGYGDISPQTPLGQFLAAMLMIAGYGIIAVPTGIVSSEMAALSVGKKNLTKTCQHCTGEGHDFDALYCKYCGEEIAQKSKT